MNRVRLLVAEMRCLRSTTERETKKDRIRDGKIRNNLKINSLKGRVTNNSERVDML